MRTENIDNDAQLLILAVHAGMLTHACKQALALLKNPDADIFDANRVEQLLEQALKGVE
jgi:hypothetical protein